MVFQAIISILKLFLEMAKVEMNNTPRKIAWDFTALVDAVRRVHDECAAAVNRTVRSTPHSRSAIGSLVGTSETMNRMELTGRI